MLAGSETWTYALATQLKKMGHDVSCFTPTPGVWSTRLRQNGIPSYQRISVTGVQPFSIILEPKIDHQYDAIIANHRDIVGHLRKEFPKTPLIATIHGIMHFMRLENGERVPAPEHPTLDAGVNQFVAVSEEVRQKLQKDYNIESVIVRNFFDIFKLGKIKKVNAKPQRFFVNTNYAGKDDPEIAVIREIVKHYKAKLIAVGMNFTSTPDIEKAITDADVVIGMGRSVLEGVAAGRLGIVHGRWGTGGIVCEANIEELRQVNFSGRKLDSNKNNFWTKEQFIEAIDQYYKPQVLEWGKQYVAREHNVVFAAGAYLEVIKELTGRNVAAAPDSGLRPYRRAKDVAASKN